MAKNLLAVQTKLTAERFMDNVEIEALRDMYTEELEEPSGAQTGPHQKDQRA